MLQGRLLVKEFSKPLQGCNIIAMSWLYPATCVLLYKLSLVSLPADMLSVRGNPLLPHLISIAQLRMLNNSTRRPPRQDAATGALHISLLMSMLSSL